MTGDESQRGFQRCPVSSWSSRLIGSSKCDSTSVAPQLAKFILLPFFFRSLLQRQHTVTVEFLSFVFFPRQSTQVFPPLEQFIVWIDSPASTLSTSETTWPLSRQEHCRCRPGAAPPGMTAEHYGWT